VKGHRLLQVTERALLPWEVLVGSRDEENNPGKACDIRAKEEIL
jgi:hypothetical protein